MWFGEVSLAGEVRPVAHAGVRRREAAKLGFKIACGPPGTPASGAGEGGGRMIELAMLPNLVDRILAQA